MQRISPLVAKSVLDSLRHGLQSHLVNDQRTILNGFVAKFLQKENPFHVNLISESLQSLAAEEPEKEAIWLVQNDTNQCKRLTYNEIHQETCRWANILTSKEFDLSNGNTVLSVLPVNSKERLLLQLACHQSGLVFCQYDPKSSTENDIHQIIRKLGVDCIITNDDYFNIVHQSTQTPLRPLVKGLIETSSTDKQLSIGWSNILPILNNADNKYEKVVQHNRDTPVVRFLSTNKNVIQYSLENFNRRILQAACWLNIEKPSHLIWMDNQKDIRFLAPWLFGSSIFCKEPDNLKTLLNTIRHYPIDAVCATSTNYQMIENQQDEKQENTNQLQQLFSFQKIDSNIKSLWHSLTKLKINDDYPDFNNE